MLYFKKELNEKVPLHKTKSLIQVESKVHKAKKI